MRRSGRIQTACGWLPAFYRWSLVLGEVRNFLIHYALDVQIWIVVGIVLLVMTIQYVLQERPLFRLIVRLKSAWIKKEEENALFSAIDELAPVIEVLGILRWNEPRRNFASIDHESLGG